MDHVYHTSPKKITEIYSSEMFGDVLFFASRPYSMGDAQFTYAMGVSCVDVCEVEYSQADIEHLSSLLGCSCGDAEEVLLGYSSTFDFSDDFEIDFFVQQVQAQAAKKTGYDGAIAEDEQGAVYMIPMAGRFDDLRLC